MLTERQQLILRIIVDDYVQSAEPVGSRLISKHIEVSLSPASIRNVMADLEEMGYLEQPHISSGRVPSEKGYRFYVDHLLPPVSVSEEEVRAIRRLLMERIDEMEQVVQQTAQILSSLTNYTSIVLGPQIYEQTLKHLQLIPLHERSAVAIMVTNTGRVENKKVTVPEGISLDEIRKLVAILNEKLTGTPIYQIKKRLYDEIAHELRRYMEQFEGAMDLFNQIVKTDANERIYLGGTAKILDQPEFRDVEKLRPLLDILEQSKTVVQLLGANEEPGIRVRIGQENDVDEFKNCSVISASYAIDGKHVGAIGVIGPTRMDYARVIKIINHLAAGLSAALTRLHK
ncbi:heat-inducible transcription repressor HrcA [Collibacillus ludicampi]|jgi:heat-inducible transcriptional repressor|uniref:Heat-inducible transcription repressor HrcA n=1 Tax=Collibacillus ludicampi TaxID=2771369 RepID=A0AAV4LI62_9BACL|nr:heat-inducible transcriptional repressor HrcA [Collibacillus ludicampi]GIM47353.1 heat-inducible transcription repressor HrcA [Collibacillus ludicampi]